MKSYNQVVLIKLMKIVSFSFVILMSLGFINIITAIENESSDTIKEEEIELQFNSSKINLLFNQNERSYSFLLFAFVLGAFWNYKRILRIGII